MTALLNMPRAAWRRQPSGAVTLVHSFVADALLPTHGKRTVKGAEIVSVGNTHRMRAALGGLAYGHTDVVSMYRALFHNPDLNRVNSVSLALLVQFRLLANPASDRATVAALGSDSGSSGNTLFLVAVDTSSKIQALIGSASSTGSWYNSNISTNDNKTHTALIEACVSASGFTIYKRFTVDGIYQVSDSFGGSVGKLPYAWLCALGNRRTTDMSGELNAEVLLAAAFVFPPIESYGLTVEQTFSLTTNPYQIFNHQQPRFYLIPSSGGATTHDVALTLAYTAAFQPTATAQFNTGITLATLAGALSGKNAQFNTALTLDTNVSVTLQRALSALASVQLDMTAAQSVSALNAAVAAITESISCSYTSSVTAHLLASLSFGITQALISGTGSQLAAALTLALNAGTQASTTATYAADLTLFTTLQAALQATLATTANLTLPATLTLTFDGERLTDGDVALALNVQTGISTSATALLSAQLTLATQLLATPAGVASFQVALTLAQQIGTLFSTGNTLASSLSFAVSMALADSAALSLGGSLELGTVLSQVQSALASFQAGVTFQTALTLPITGGLAMEDGISLGWTLGTNIDGAFFEITVTLPTGRVIVLAASERLLSISASERLITIPPHDPLVSI